MFCIFLCGCQNRQLHKDSRVMMGTFVEVVSSDRRAAGIAFAEIKRLEDLLSKYKPNSEVSRLNKLGQLNVSPDTMYVIKRAKEFWVTSEGAFDVTVGPLMDLWGFTTKKFILPKEEEIKNTLQRVGTDKILLNDNDNMVEFGLSGMEIDLGAIAKGYAVDCAIKKLKLNGIKSCLINAGGDIYCLGDKFGKPWGIALQDPQGPGLLERLSLRDSAIATSGDYEQCFIKDGKRYSHIFNPRTGFPTDSGVASVTVIAPDCLTADALATAIFVLGKEKGEALARKFPRVRVKIIEENYK
jgi:thiamine biosynthesis lipoprotein